MTAISDATAPRGQNPWATAAILLIAAYAVVLFTAAAMQTAGHWAAAPDSIVVPAGRLDLVRGVGRRSGEAVVIDPLGNDGVTVLSTRVTPFQARDYPRVEWNIRTAERNLPELSLLWGTREQPGRTYSLPIPWPGYGPAVVELGAQEGWRGTITGLGLAVRGPSVHPLAVTAVTVPGVSVASILAEIAGQWTTFFPFRGISITLPFDEQRTSHVSLLAATAMALGLAAAAYALAARYRKRRPDARVLWAMLLVGWLIVDLRWQANLGWQLVQTARQFAGKSLEEKHEASIDHELYAVIRKVNEVLPPPPVRIVFLADNSVLRMRGSYFFYPRNVYHDLARSKPRLPDPDQLRAGDYVVLFLHTGLAYDRERRMLVWPDGRQKSVAEVLFEDPGPAVLRVQ